MRPAAAIGVVTLALVACASGSASARTIWLNAHSTGKSVHVHVGDRVHVRLGGGTTGSYDQPVSTGHALVPVSASGGYPSTRPASAVFAARHRGSSTITAETDFACLHATPRCLVAQQIWRVRVIVAR